jgi:hypothetical protein
MRIRQIVFAVRDLRQGSLQLAALLGLDPPFRDPGVAEFGLDNAVYVFGDQFVELVSPVTAGTAAGRLIERRGDGGYMLLLQTDDFERDRARITKLGVRTVWQKDLPDIRAMHLHPKDLGGAIVSVDEPKPAASWRWGGSQWRRQPGRRAEQRVVGVTIEAHDPRAMAERWAEVLGLASPDASGARHRLALQGGHVDFVPAGLNGDGIAGFTLRVADPAAVLRAAGAHGLAVQGQAVTAFGTRLDLQAA